MKKIIFISCLALFAACKDDNDDNNNGGGGGTSTTVSDQDRSFTEQASMANYEEVQAAQDAVNKSTDTTILSFAAQMISDHQAALSQLHDIADSLNVYAPDSIDSAHVALTLQLALLNGRAYDSVYIHSQAADHATALTLFQTESNSGSHTMIKNYASSKISVLQMHKQMADSIAATY
jgi:putative membrane protein